MIKIKGNKYSFCPDCVIGYTSKGEEFYIDFEDYDLVKKYTWFKDEDYISGTVDGVKTKMHRFLTECPNELDVDHRNHVEHDNRRYNLRICTNAENSKNRIPKRGDMCGVHFRYNHWIARIGGKQLGSFETKEEAIQARKDAEEKLYGEYSYDNSVGYDMPRKVIVLTPSEVGKILKIGKNQVYALMNKDDFPSYRIGNKFFVTNIDLTEWMLNLAGKTIDLGDKNE